MAYELVKLSNKRQETFIIVLILVVVGILLFKFMDIYPFKSKHQEKFTADNINNSISNDDKSYTLGVCSKNCCTTQWPVPINLTEKSKVTPDMVGKNKKYSRSNLTCNNGVINTGCLCLTKKSRAMLENRGYVDKLPISNGLLDEDHRIGVFKIMEDKTPRPVNVLGETTELTGTKKVMTTGKLGNKFDNRIDKFRTVQSEKELVDMFSMPVNTNIITYDNQEINDALLESNISGNEIADGSSEVDKLLARPIGFDVKDFIVDRK